MLRPPVAPPPPLVAMRTHVILLWYSLTAGPRQASGTRASAAAAAAHPMPWLRTTHAAPAPPERIMVMVACTVLQTSPAQAPTPAVLAAASCTATPTPSSNRTEHVPYTHATAALWRNTQWAALRVSPPWLQQQPDGLLNVVAGQAQGPRRRRLVKAHGHHLLQRLGRRLRLRPTAASAAAGLLPLLRVRVREGASRRRRCPSRPPRPRPACASSPCRCRCGCRRLVWPQQLAERRRKEAVDKRRQLRRRQGSAAGQLRRTCVCVTSRHDTARQARQCRGVRLCACPPPPVSRVHEAGLGGRHTHEGKVCHKGPVPSQVPPFPRPPPYLLPWVLGRRQQHPRDLRRGVPTRPDPHRPADSPTRPPTRTRFSPRKLKRYIRPAAMPVPPATSDETPPDSSSCRPARYMKTCGGGEGGSRGRPKPG